MHKARDRHTQRHRRVEDARTIDVYTQTSRMRRRARRVGVCDAHGRPALAVDRIFKRKQARTRKVHIVGIAHGVIDLQRVKHPAVPFNRPQCHATKHACAARFVIQQVRVWPAQDFIAPARLRQNADKIAHRAAQQQQGALFAQDLGRHRLEAVDGRVFAEDVVTNLCGRHCRAHRRRRMRHRVTTEIDHCLFLLDNYHSPRRKAPHVCVEAPRLLGAMDNDPPSETPRRVGKCVPRPWHRHDVRDDSPIRRSVPFAMRRMLSRCDNTTNMPAKIPYAT